MVFGWGGVRAPMVAKSEAMDTSHRRSIAAITAQAVMLGYFLVINWIKLSPWNNLDRSGDQTLSTLVGVVPGVTVIGVLLFGGRRARRIAAVWTWVWLLLQILQWWVPYLTGLHPLTQDGGRWYFEGGYDQTVHLLPTEAGGWFPTRSIRCCRRSRWLPRSW